ncbi:MAG: porin [Opitutaceae bacterium]|nr:porin [Opitutaceae bacterium]
MNTHSQPTAAGIGLVRAAAIACAMSFSTFSAPRAAAETKLSEMFSMDGYIAASGIRHEARGKEQDYSHTGIGAAKLGFAISSAPVRAYAGIYHDGGAYGTGDTLLLDAYVDWNLGRGFTLTGGRFLSFLGYESFHAADMNQISYANGDFLAPIPGYHSGAKFTFGNRIVTCGLALLDSVYGTDSAFAGDGETSANYGIEDFVQLTLADGKVTLFAGTGFETSATNSDYPVWTQRPASFVFNFWAGWQIGERVTLAAEFTYKKTSRETVNGLYKIGGEEGHNALLMLKVKCTEKFSVLGRVSEELITKGDARMSFGKKVGFVKETFSPTYAINDNFLIRAEISGYTYINEDDNYYYGYDVGTSFFAGAQIVFKF